VKYFLKIRGLFKGLVWCLVFCIPFLTGCSEQEKNSVTQFLIKTSFITVSSSDFLEELDLKKAAYPYNIKNNPDEYNEIIISLVKMLSEEIVLLSAAADKQIIVTDQDVLSAEKEFKKEYLEDSFDQILLENAISYSLWKKRFKKNMIMEKLIGQELKQKIRITPEDIVEFYNRHNIESKKELKNSKNSAVVLNKIDNEKELVKRLRMQKTEESYVKWIQDLYTAYPVEINKNLLKTFLIEINTDKDDKNDKKK
jgi:hypothetical protein